MHKSSLTRDDESGTDDGVGTGAYVMVYSSQELHRSTRQRRRAAFLHGIKNMRWRLVEDNLGGVRLWLLAWRYVLHDQLCACVSRRLHGCEGLR